MNTASWMNDVSHPALEIPLTLGRTAVLGMDPVPSTDAAALGARRHVLGNIEVSVGIPNTRVVNGKNGQVLGLDAPYVRGVCNGEATTLQVIEALGGNISAVPNHASEVEDTHGS